MLRNNVGNSVSSMRVEGNAPDRGLGATMRPGRRAMRALFEGSFDVLPKMWVEDRRRSPVLCRVRHARRCCWRRPNGGVPGPQADAVAGTAPQPADTAAEVSLDDLSDAPAAHGVHADAAANAATAQPGTPVPATDGSQPGASTAAPDATQSDAPTGKRKRSKKPLIIAAVMMALLAAGGGAGYYFGVYAPERAREAAEQEALAAKHAVRFSVSAQGWDTSAGASRLPLHITGKEERGKKVDVVRYVDTKGDGVTLRRGNYKAEVAASPIAADGTIYAVPSDRLDLKLNKKTSSNKKKTIDAGSVSLTPVEATEVTDDEVAAAKKYAEEDKGAKKAGFTFDADTLATAATKRRDDAIAAKQAEEEAKRQAEEAAKKAAEAKQARTIDTDYFTMVLPDWFPIDEFNVETYNHEDKGDGQGAYIEVSFTAKESFYSNGEWDPNECPNFTIFADTNGLPGLGCAFYKELGKSNGRTVRLLGGAYGEVDGKKIVDKPFGMSLDDYANTLASCITLK